MTPAREEAILDCKYALSLGEQNLRLHIAIWKAGTAVQGEDVLYRTAIFEIERKLGTSECLLRDK